MISTKQFMFHFLAFLLVVTLVGCGGADTKPEKDKFVEITEDQLPVIPESEQEMRERFRLAKLEQLGSNPYLSNRALVSRQAKIDFASANEALATGDEVAAEALFLKVVEAYPELSGASYNLAIMKSGQGDNKAALSHLETALARNNNHLDAHILKAYVHRIDGDFAAAEKEYIETIELWGAFLPALKNLGILYDLYMGKLAEALFHYEQYNSLLEKQDRQVLGWSVDLERQMKKKGIKKIEIDQPETCAPVQAEGVVQADGTVPAAGSAVSASGVVTPDAPVQQPCVLIEPVGDAAAIPEQTGAQTAAQTDRSSEKTEAKAAEESINASPEDVQSLEKKKE